MGYKKMKWVHMCLSKILFSSARKHVKNNLYRYCVGKILEK